MSMTTRWVVLVVAAAGCGGLERVRKSGATLGSYSLLSLAFSGSNLVGVITKSGVAFERSGSQLVGAKFTGLHGDGSLVELRIAEHVMDTDPDINMMRLAVE